MKKLIAKITHSTTFYIIILPLGFVLVLFPIILLEVAPYSKATHYIVAISYFIAVFMAFICHHLWQESDKRYFNLRRYIERNIQKLSPDPHISVSKFMFEIEE
ncbi:MAG: hypothetical protein AAB038_02900 [Planctomycetota bacterium]